MSSDSDINQLMQIKLQQEQNTILNRMARDASGTQAHLVDRIRSLAEVINDTLRSIMPD